MLAGLARLVEVCFVVPKFLPLGTIEGVEDDQSEHTLADSTTHTTREDNTPKGVAFRHLPPFVRPLLSDKRPFFANEMYLHVMTAQLLVCAGLLFMSGTDEELEFAHDQGMDHVTYVLIMYRCVACP